MRAVRLIAPREIRCVEMPVPVPGPGEVLVKVAAAGICGTDRHLYLGEFPCQPPVTLGHEFSGTIEAVGAGVGMQVGTAVACDPNTWCGTCDACSRGRVNLCSSNVATGIHRDGGLAEYAVFPAWKAVPLPAGFDILKGAFAEPLACTLHGLDVGAPRPGERVIVLSGGVIGLLAVQLARLAGAETMLLTRSDGKRALGLQAGARVTAATPEEAKEVWPQGADLVLECAGVPATVAAAPTLARAGGRVVVLGVLAAGAKVEIEPFDLLFREVRLDFAFINPFTTTRAVELIASGAVDVCPLVSRKVSLSEGADVIAAPALGADVKVIVDPGA